MTMETVATMPMTMNTHWAGRRGSQDAEEHAHDLTDWHEYMYLDL